MDALNSSIQRLRLGAPLGFVALLIALVVGGALLLRVVQKKVEGSRLEGTPLGVMMFAVPAIPAWVLSASWPDLTPKRFLICYVAMAVAVFALLYWMLTALKGVGSRSGFARLANKGDFAALEQRFAHDDKSWQGLQALKPEALNALARYCVPEGHFSEDFYKTLAPLLDRRTAVELLSTPGCSPAFRLYLFRRFPEDAGADFGWLFDYAEKSMTAAQTLRENLARIVPKLAYPADAARLRAIAADVRNADVSIRQAAFAKIPKTDEAFSRRYCPFCGSSQIKEGPLGLRADMYLYGYTCQGCGHESAAPEMYGPPKRFDVSFAELVQKKA